MIAEINWMWSVPIPAIVAIVVAVALVSFLAGQGFGKKEGSKDLGLIRSHLERIQEKRNDQDDDLLFISDLVAAIRQGSV